MREACIQAKIIRSDDPTQLILALEPEAASLDCRQRDLSEFVDETLNGTPPEVIACNGPTYMIIDNGGGTVDITVHTINNQAVDEVYQPTGGAWGGINVETEFENLIIFLFGAKFISNFKQNSPAEWLEMMADFEMKKRSPQFVSSKASTRIRLPHAFFMNGSLMARAKGQYKPCDVKLHNGYLILSYEVMSNLFLAPVENIIKHVETLVNDDKLKNLSIIYLVGGFSESRLLTKRFEEKFGSKYRIMIPLDASLCVVKGAVLFGLNTKAVQTRICPYTYGSDVSERCDNVKCNKKYAVTQRGVCYCMVFRTLATKGEKIKVGDTRSFKYCPLFPDQTSVCFGFYTTIKDSVKYVREPYVKKIAEIILPSPDTTKGKSRLLKLDIEFGNTEIKVTTLDKESGNVKHLSLDFVKG
ncbi:heat shock 70 kDa protein 12A-like [Saccoglossus kowalevskii]|uniref:Heat shock 70 kDa protein 12A-like n=1 Tax=Saccoglossus kowalevskii TaxID=10224 RepID=A0ABM0MVD2_SACKO|nr:PREDICTED: heat shock 70 kDa protein 12A-like [Saccoglossus kowalevskii]